MTTIEEVADFISRYRVQSDEHQTIEIVRAHILDTIGALIAGGSTAEGRANTLLFSKPVIENSFLTKIIVRCANTRLSEIDDIHLASCTTPGSVVIPTVLTLAERLQGVDGKRILESIIVGYELMARLGISISGPIILYKGFWPTLICASFASAGAASKLLRLNPSEIAHALAIALAPIDGRIPRSKDRLSTRWLALGLAAQKGVVAALAAKSAFKGDISLLDEDWYVRNLRIGFDNSPLIRIGVSLKKRSLAVTQTSLKPYCMAKQIVSGAECFSHALKKGVDPDQIESLDVWVPRYYKEMVAHLPNPKERLSSISSLPYRLALIAYSQEKLFEPDHGILTGEKKIQRLMNSISVHHGRDLDKLYPSSWPARIQVRTKDRYYQEQITIAYGDPKRPFTRQYVQSKFKGVMGRIIIDKFSEDIIQMIDRIPSSNAFAHLIDSISAYEATKNQLG